MIIKRKIVNKKCMITNFYSYKKHGEFSYKTKYRLSIMEEDECELIEYVDTIIHRTTVNKVKRDYYKIYKDKEGNKYHIDVWEVVYENERGIALIKNYELRKNNRIFNNVLDERREKGTTYYKGKYLEFETLKTTNSLVGNLSHKPSKDLVLWKKEYDNITRIYKDMFKNINDKKIKEYLKAKIEFRESPDLIKLKKCKNLRLTVKEKHLSTLKEIMLKELGQKINTFPFLKG